MGYSPVHPETFYDFSVLIYKSVARLGQQLGKVSMFLIERHFERLTCSFGNIKEINSQS